MTYPDFPKGWVNKKTGLLDDGRAALLILLRLPCCEWDYAFCSWFKSAAQPSLKSR